MEADLAEPTATGVVPGDCPGGRAEGMAEVTGRAADVGGGSERAPAGEATRAAEVGGGSGGRELDPTGFAEVGGGKVGLGARGAACSGAFAASSLPEDGVRPSGTGDSPLPSCFCGSFCISFSSAIEVAV